MKKSNVRLISVDLLTTDMTYQSPVKESHVKDIVKNFNLEAVGIITVSHRDGKYHVTDGQHRVEVYKRKGIKYIYAEVHEGLTQEEEAEMYILLNKAPNKSVNSIGKADLATGETYAVDIEYYVNKAGLQVDYDKSGSVKKTISAYGTLKTIYKKHGGEHLYDVLTLSKEIYGNSYHELKAWNLKGTSDFIVTFPQHDRNRLRAVVSKHDFKDIERMTSRKSVEIGKTKQKSLPYVLVDLYNKRLSKDKQLNPLALSI